MMIHKGGGRSIIGEGNISNINVSMKRPSNKILQPLYPPIEVIVHPITSIIEEIEESAKYDKLPESDYIYGESLFHKSTAKINHTKIEYNNETNVKESERNFNNDNIITIELSDIQEYPDENYFIEDYINRLKWDEEIYGAESYSRFCPIKMNSEVVNLNNTGNYTLQSNKTTIIDSRCYKKRKTETDRIIEIVQNYQDWHYEFRDNELILELENLLNGPKSKILIRIKEKNITIINSIFPKHGYFYDLVNAQMISHGLKQNTQPISNFENVFIQLNVLVKEASDYIILKSNQIFDVI